MILLQEVSLLAAGVMIVITSYFLGRQGGSLRHHQHVDTVLMVLASQIIHPRSKWKCPGKRDHQEIRHISEFQYEHWQGREPAHLAAGMVVAIRPVQPAGPAVVICMQQLVNHGVIHLLLAVQLGLLVTAYGHLWQARSYCICALIPPVGPTAWSAIPRKGFMPGAGCRSKVCIQLVHVTKLYCRF